MAKALALAPPAAIAVLPSAPPARRRSGGQSLKAAYEKGRQIGSAALTRYKAVDAGMRGAGESLALAAVTGAAAGYYVKQSGGVLPTISASTSLTWLDAATMGLIALTLYAAKKAPKAAMRLVGPTSALVGIASFGYAQKP